MIGSATGEVTLWDVRRASRLQQLRPFGEPVDAIAFSADGALVAAGSRDGTLQVWQADSAALRSQLEDQEVAISKRSATFRAQQRPVTVSLGLRRRPRGVRLGAVGQHQRQQRRHHHQAVVADDQVVTGQRRQRQLAALVRAAVVVIGLFMTVALLVKQ